MLRLQGKFIVAYHGFYILLSHYITIWKWVQMNQLKVKHLPFSVE